MATDRDIATWIRRQLERREWSPADLTRHLGVGTGRVSEWLSGKRRPSPASCLKLADVFDADPDVVLALAGHRPPTPSSDPWREVKALLDRARPEPDRVLGLEGLLRGWIRFDREAAAAATADDR